MSHRGNMVGQQPYEDQISESSSDESTNAEQPAAKQQSAEQVDPTQFSPEFLEQGIQEILGTEAQA